MEVLGRRDDGFHDLSSVFLRVGMSDRLTLQPGAGPEDRLTVTGLAGVPTAGNLVLQALQALRQHAGLDLPPLDVTLEKQIPVAAGLGGGSSDCASAIRLAAACWGVSIAPADELALAASLGSDVPFFIGNHPAAAMGGRGERLMPLPAVRGDGGLLLVTPPIALSTAAVFDRFDRLGEQRGGRMTGELLSALESGITGARLAEWAHHLHDSNDLWPAAASLEPALLGLRETLTRLLGRPVLLSGSGSTLFALYASAQEAAAAGKELAERRLPELQSALINAVDLVGPDPKWRFP